MCRFADWRYRLEHHAEVESRLFGSIGVRALINEIWLLWCKSMPTVPGEAQASCGHGPMEVLRKGCKYFIITNLLTHHDKAFIPKIKLNLELGWSEELNSPNDWSIQVWAHSFIMLQLDALRKVDQKTVLKKAVRLHRMYIMSETEPTIKQK